MNKMYTVILTIAAIALMVPSNAIATCDMALATPELTVPDASGQAGGDVYVDNDFCQLDGCSFSLWVYQETNGVAGLQRGDEVENDVDTCTDGTVADTDIF
jgi:hypothetical protein